MNLFANDELTPFSRIKNMRRLRNASGEPDNWRCNGERRRNLDLDRVAGLALISQPAVNINLFARRHQTWP